jgi:GT2 family glycosyltransferase
VIAGCGAATLFRRSVLEDIGGLDEDFFAYLDDMDLGLRAQLADHRGIYTPEAVAWHVGSATLGNVLHPHITEFLTRNQLFLLLKDYPARALCQLAVHIAGFQLLWLALVIRRHHFWPYMRGLAGALLRAPRMLAKRRRVMRARRIRSAQFLALLRASERQVLQWQAALPENARSGLLRAYFRCFQRG